MRPRRSSADWGLNTSSWFLLCSLRKCAFCVCGTVVHGYGLVWFHLRPSEQNSQRQPLPAPIRQSITHVTSRHAHNTAHSATHDNTHHHVQVAFDSHNVVGLGRQAQRVRAGHHHATTDHREQRDELQLPVMHVALSHARTAGFFLLSSMNFDMATAARQHPATHAIASRASRFRTRPAPDAARLCAAACQRIRCAAPDAPRGTGHAGRAE